MIQKIYIFEEKNVFTFFHSGPMQITNRLRLKVSGGLGGVPF